MSSADSRVARQTRASGKGNDNADDERTEFARDLDRVPYNRYWLRLAETTQVYSEGGLMGRAAEQPLQHNRMTHSQKVAQLGRRLAQQLQAHDGNAAGIQRAGGLDTDVVEAACLIHDLGHPPFGHIGEQELDRLARDAGLPDGFEGNAQTFRILVALSVHDPEMPDAGMDLTSAVLAASTKYPWPRDLTPNADGFVSRRWRKYGFYEVDRVAFDDRVQPILPRGGGKTLEAQVMDWADDISYAVHDVEDFYKAGLIPLDRLRHVDRGGPDRQHFEAVQQREVTTFERYANNRLGAELTDPDRAWNQFYGFATGFPEGPYEGRRLQDRIMDKLASKIITASTKATRIREDGMLDIDDDARAVIDVLKQLTWHYVVERADLATQQVGQRRRLALVFAHWLEQARAASATEQLDPLTNKTRKLTAAERWLRRNTLPVRLDEFVQQLVRRGGDTGALQQAVARGVADYVASLREKEVDRYAEFLGPSALAPTKTTNAHGRRNGE